MNKLRAVVAGLGMGLAHCDGLVRSGRFELVGVCDISDPALSAARARFPGVAAYQDYSRMLREVAPEVVVVATPNVLHHRQAMEALELAGLRGLVVEKPMTLTLGEARQIIETASARGVEVMVNHQRRTWPAFRTMRRLIREGAVGTPQLIRASCAGDFLSDGTHLVDNVRFLAGDVGVRCVSAAVYREISPKFTGTRFGHATDSGAMAVLEFVSGVRAELFTGDMQPRGRMYQDYEILGVEGRIWRAGDSAALQVVIQDHAGGFRQVPLDPWDVPEFPTLDLTPVYVRFQQQVTEGYDNPMSGRHGLAAMEVCTAVYESARQGRRLFFPLDDGKVSLDRFALDVMIEAGKL